MAWIHGIMRSWDQGIRGSGDEGHDQGHTLSTPLLTGMREEQHVHEKSAVVALHHMSMMCTVHKAAHTRH